MFRYTLLLEEGSEEDFVRGRQWCVFSAALGHHLVTSQDDDEREPDENSLFTHGTDEATEIFGQLTEGDVR
ncbi:hypothetical protein LCGC14_3057410 [marine sediment metagenome]|uniref:Uncharacterized protein n=1 Tax=marine sediment metagenome TaxID=412755 RepID=A0A0F8WKE8_9ZZZZ